MTLLFDTHIHLDLLDERAELLAVARQYGIHDFVVPGTTPQRWPDLIDVVQATAGAWAAPGIHPMAADQCQLPQLEELRRLLDHPRVVAVGEVGLDRQVQAGRTAQEQTLRSMIRLARDADKPLLIHARGMTGRLLELLREEQADRVGGIFHAFNGSLETARQVITLGFALGIGGVVTFPEAHRLPDVIRQVAPEWLVLETDAPDMPPYPHRGRSNRPEHLTLVADRLAELRGWTPAETAQITNENSRRILRLT